MRPPDPNTILSSLMGLATTLLTGLIAVSIGRRQNRIAAKAQEQSADDARIARLIDELRTIHAFWQECQDDNKELDQRIRDLQSELDRLKEELHPHRKSDRKEE